MSILEILGIAWLTLIVFNFLVALRLNAAKPEETTEVQKKVNQILALGLDIKIEIIEFNDATVYYAYTSINKKFLLQGRSEGELLENLAKKYGATTKFNIISREYVEITYN